MKLPNKRDILKLSKIQNKTCVSLYMPTHIFGKEVLQKLDIKLYKNHLKEIKNKLKNELLSRLEINQLLLPLNDLKDNSSFWRNQNKGLVIFLWDGRVEYFNSPLSFKSYNYVSNNLYLLPLLRLYSEKAACYVLWLKIGDVKLYKFTKHRMEKISIDNLIPSSIEERVGEDYRQKNLQFRSYRSVRNEQIYHGNSEADFNRKDEILRYFRSINEGLQAVLKTEKLPLIIASQENLIQIYRKVNTYNGLMSDHIIFNSAQNDTFRLSAIVNERLNQFFNADRSEIAEFYRSNEGTGRTSTNVKKVTLAALKGRIEAVFINNEETDVFGICDIDKNTVRIDNAATLTNVSLLNLIAIHTFLHGGKVFITDRDLQPNPYHTINAIYK